jgi:hypothetical protein
MKLGEILDQGFSLYRKNFWRFVGVVLIPCGIMLALRLANEFWWRLRAPQLAHLFGRFNIGTLLFLLGLFQIRSLLDWIAYPPLINLALAEPAEALTIRSLWHGWGERWKRNSALLGLQFLVVLFLPEFVGFVLFSVAGYLVSLTNLDETQFGAIFAPIFLFSVAVGIAGYFWLSASFSFAWPAAFSESLNTREAMGRGWRLSRDVRWRVAVARSLPVLLWWALTFAIGIVFDVSFVVFRTRLHMGMLLFQMLTVGYVLASFVVDLLLSPVFPIALALLYRDHRVRKEGYDIEQLIDAVGLAVTASADAVVKGSDPQAAGESLA